MLVNQYFMVQNLQLKFGFSSKETKEKKNSPCFAIYVSVSFIETGITHYFNAYDVRLNFVMSATPGL